MTTLLRKMWKNHSKHKKLCEEWALAECEGEGWWREAREGRGSSEVRYAGVAPVERAASAPATALAVRSALHTAKSEGWWREAREGRGSGEVRYAGVAPVERAASAPATALAVRSALHTAKSEGWWREAREGRGSGEMRYAGVAPVERAASAPATALAVRSALHTAKTLNKKLQRVNLDISPKGILVSDAESQDNVLSVSIYRISYCSADAANARVFAVVEGKSAGGEESHVVHVFVCARRKQARALALSLAHAFNDAYQAWQANEAASLKSGGQRLVTPWVHFPDESDEEIDNEQSWNAPAPLVTFA